MSTLDLTVAPNPVRVRRMEVITGDVGRRIWSPDAKARILAEAALPGAVVADVARRHGLRPQQVFGWRRAARVVGHFQEEGMVFAPVVLDGVPSSPVLKEPPTIEVQIGDAPLSAYRPAWMEPPSRRSCMR